jgi:hypothetical protein
VYLLEMARFVVKVGLTTNAPLLDQINTRGAAHVVRVALMVNRRMTTGGSACAFVRASRWTCTARLRRVQNCRTAVAANLFPNCFRTALASSTVAELLAKVATAFQRSSTCLNADVLSLNGK